jgi:hypothetical protein
MPIEVRELIVKVNVGENSAPATPALKAGELAALKRQLVQACLAELRQELASRRER